MQQAHCLLAGGGDGAFEAAVDANEAFASKLFGESTALAALDMDKFRQQLASVDELVRKAPEALHTAQRAQRKVNNMSTSR